jgi:hypothetical protein
VAFLPGSVSGLAPATAPGNFFAAREAIRGIDSGARMSQVAPMNFPTALDRYFRVARLALAGLLAPAVMLGMSGCTGGWSGTPLATGVDAGNARVAEITEKLVALPGAGEAARGDAQRVAREAVKVSGELAVGYRIVRPAGLHNCLVNTERRERGLCWHWMEDLYPRLRSLEVEKFEFVCAVRDPGRLFREHHCVVAIPKGRGFNDGLVLDPWEKGGNLIAFPVNGAKRPWLYDDGWTKPLDARYRASVSKRPAR